MSIIEPPFFRIPRRKTSLRGISPNGRKFSNEFPRHGLHRTSKLQPHVPSLNDYLIYRSAVCPKIYAGVQDPGEQADNDDKTADNNGNADNDGRVYYRKPRFEKAEVPIAVRVTKRHARLERGLLDIWRPRAVLEIVGVYESCHR